jgi:hypothetical protein
MRACIVHDVRYARSRAPGMRRHLTDDGMLAHARDQLDKWSRDYMGGDEAYPGDGGGFDFVCSVAETGEVVGCPSDGITG